MFGWTRTRQGLRQHGALLAIEVVSIFLSVLLAFSLGNWQQHRRDRELADQALNSILREIGINRNELSRTIPAQTELLEALRHAPDSLLADSSGFGAMVGLWPTDKVDFPGVQRSAWEAAMQSGALSHLDYDVVTRLSLYYSIQQMGYETTFARLNDFLWRPEMFNPELTRYQIAGLARLLENLIRTEEWLLKQCEMVLEQLGEDERPTVEIR